MCFYSRWLDDENWPQVKNEFFGALPALVRPFISRADATVYPFLSAILLSSLDSPLKRSAEQHKAFRPYVARMQARFFPDFHPENLN